MDQKKMFNTNNPLWLLIMIDKILMWILNNNEYDFSKNMNKVRNIQ